MFRTASALALLTAIAACSAEISSKITIDGAPFAATSCHSGQALGFSGIQLKESSGRRLRMLAMGDGTFQAALFAPGAAKGTLFGPCGTLVMEAQSSRINGITNMEGNATLACSHDGIEIRGTVTFKNCH